jgi:hypothetical protein
MSTYRVCTGRKRAKWLKGKEDRLIMFLDPGTATMCRCRRFRWNRWSRVSSKIKIKKRRSLQKTG